MKRTPEERAQQRKLENQQMGIVRLGNGKLAWGLKHGWFHGWPYLFKRAIVHFWNPIGCFFYGHSHLCREAPGKLPVCCDCSRKVKPTPEQERSVINEW